MMPAENVHQLWQAGPLSKVFIRCGITTFEQALDYVKSLPYGRNSRRDQFQVVLEEGQGTCSSKHALLKGLADELNLHHVKLVLVLYAMNGINTPKVGEVLDFHQIDDIPEAHCALLINENLVDITTARSRPDLWKNDVLEQREIEALDVVSKKVVWHQAFIRKWIKEVACPYTFDEIWAIREKCIAALSS